MSHFANETELRGARLALGACVVLAIFVSPAIAQERILTEESPPTDAVEVQTPIELVFPEKVERVSIFGSKLEGAAPFVADTLLEVRARSYYWKSDSLTDVLTEDWALGGSIYYHSGRVADIFAVELEGFTSQPLWAPDDSLGGGNLLSDGDGYSVVGIANASFRFAGMTLTAGRLYQDLPYVNKGDIRMTPNTFEAIKLEKPEGKIKFTVGYTSKIKFRNSEDFVSMTRQLGFDQDEGLYHGGLVWDPKESFSIGAIAQVVPDLFEGIYGEMLWYKIQVSDKLGGRLDTQATWEKENGDNLKNIAETWNIGIRGSIEYDKLLFRIGFSATGPEPIQNPYGLVPSYLDLMSRTFNKAREKAVLGSVSYNFEGLGAKGFKAVLNYAQSNDALFQGEPIRAREADLSFDYRGQKGWWKGLWVRLRQAWREESWTDEDLYQLRFQVYYTLNVI